MRSAECLQVLAQWQASWKTATPPLMILRNANCPFREVGRLYASHMPRFMEMASHGMMVSCAAGFSFFNIGTKQTNKNFTRTLALRIASSKCA